MTTPTEHRVDAQRSIQDAANILRATSDALLAFVASDLRQLDEHGDAYAADDSIVTTLTQRCQAAFQDMARAGTTMLDAVNDAGRARSATPTPAPRRTDALTVAQRIVLDALSARHWQALGSVAAQTMASMSTATTARMLAELVDLGLARRSEAGGYSAVPLPTTTTERQ